MLARARRQFLLAAMLALIPVVPGAYANRAATNEWNAVLSGEAPADSINFRHQTAAWLLAPGIILSPAVQLLLFKTGYGTHFWFWLNIGEALVSWIVYFAVILLFLIWFARRKFTRHVTAPGS